MNYIQSISNFIKKNAPTILTWGGLALGATGVVLACKETRKIDPIIDNHNAKMAEIHQSEEIGKDVVNCSDGDYTEKEARRDTFKQYVATGKEFAKLYWPAAVCLTGSAACSLGSNKILNNRYLAVTAAYTTLQTCYDNYRNNVVAKYGEDADKELRLGLKANKAKKGEEKTYSLTEKKDISNMGYSRFFDETNKLWVKNIDLNLETMILAQNAANQRLKARGYVTLNEVYENLAYEPTQSGQVIGWVYDPHWFDDLSHKYDQIDFGIMPLVEANSVGELNKSEYSFMLDFKNLDGNVISKIPMKV